MAKGRSFTDQFRAKVALEALRGDKTVQEEEIYLEEITDGFHARRGVKNWMAFYNARRPHSALDRQTPDQAYWTGLEEQKAV